MDVLKHELLFRAMANDDEVKASATLMSSSEPFTSLKFSFDKCVRALTANPSNVFFVGYKNEFAGFLIIQTEGAFRGYIQTLCVQPHLRSKGIGSAMIRFAEEKISEVSPNVFMCVTSYNDRAQKLYYSLGYEKVAVLKDFIIKGADEYLLRKAGLPWSEFTAKAK